MEQPFAHLKVVELASVLAGPAVGLFFAELGANVLKVENRKTGGDVTRSWRLPNEKVAQNQSAYFSAVNAGKTHLFLDVATPTDFSKLLDELADADVLIVNFKAGDAEKFGLTWEFLHDKFPRLILATLQGFESNPERVAYDVVVQAETGYMSMNGTGDSGPLKMPVALMDVMAAHQLKQGVLTALYKRDVVTQKGSWVISSLERAGITNLVNQASNYLMAGHIPERMGSLHPNIAPYGDTFACQDKRHIVLAVGSDAQFAKLCHVLGHGDLAKDSQLQTNVQRVKNREYLNEQLAPLFLQHPMAAILENCIAANIPAGAIKSLDEVFSDPFAQSLVWETHQNGVTSKRVRTAGFVSGD